MAEHDRDEELSRRYRELAREEPPRALDDAILAASRREVRSHPAPLVAPSGRRRWFVPVAAAAVIVLSAVVTLHVQREQPDEELRAPQIAQAPARKDEAPAPRAEVREERVAPKTKENDALYSKVEPQKVQPDRRQRQAAPAPKPATPSQAPAGEPSALARAPAEAKPAEQERFSPDPGPVPAAPAAPPPAPVAQPAPRAADSASSAAGAAVGVAPPPTAEGGRAFGGLRDSPRLDQQRALAKREAQVEPPEKMLERIATLRREGRQREADDLYAEFKRRFPDYRIPDALREQVAPR